MKPSVASRQRSERTGLRLPKTPLGWIHLGTGTVGVLLLLAAIAYAFAPLLVHVRTLGSADWDAMATHRYLVTKTLSRFHQFPFWNPYSCGGHPAWGGPEGDPIVVSPWLPAYLLMPLSLAIRTEVVGSTLLGALGVWLLASRFTRSRALRLLVSALFVLNSRATLQLAVGHGWHATYAYMPWVLYFYDRAAEVEPRVARSWRRDLVLAAVFLAMLVYTGGLYPLPHTAVALAGYALLLSVTTRSLVPAVRMVACAVLGAALSAPRLLPLLEVTRRFPRLIDSTETMDPAGFLVMLTSRDQDTSSMPVRVSEWAWHEWGMYIGWPSLLAILIGLLAVHGARERSLRIVGGIFVLLAFGAFSEYAPWTLLHTMPVFSSQHVPSRWMMPALLLLACAAASTGESFLTWTGRWRGVVEIGALVVVAFLVRDLSKVARIPLVHAFERQPPAQADSIGEFRTVKHVPRDLDYDPDGYASTTLSAALTNIDSIDCSTFGAYSNYLVREKSRSPGLGARAVGDAEYRGEAYVAEGRGTARILKFTPNAVDVRVEGAQAGDRVILNQNWDPGWTADSKTALSWHDAVAGIVPAGSATVHFRYWPRTLTIGLLVLTLTLALLAFPWAPSVFGRFHPRARRRDPTLREPHHHLRRRDPPPL